MTRNQPFFSAQPPLEGSTVHTLLRDLAESPAPPSAVDIARAAVVGRRRVWVRRCLAGGSAAVAVLAVGSAVGLLIGEAPLPQPAPAGPAASATATEPPMPDAAPAAFDPLVQYAELGWLPGGSVGSGVSIWPDLMTVSADYVGLPTSGDDPTSASVQVVLPTAGSAVEPYNPSDPVESGQRSAGTAADPVNGRPAEWVDVPFTALRWEYAPDTWALAIVSVNLPDVDTREVARRVAENVRYGVDAPVRLPFSTTGVPAQMPVAMVDVHRYEPGWGVQVDFGADRTSYGDFPLTILAVRSDMETGDGAVIGDPNTTVDGHPARTSTGLDGGSGLQVFNVGGVYVEMLTHSPWATDQLPDGLVGLFRATEFYVDPVDWR